MTTTSLCHQPSSAVVGFWTGRWQSTWVVAPSKPHYFYMLPYNGYQPSSQFQSRLTDLPARESMPDRYFSNIRFSHLWWNGSMALKRCVMKEAPLFTASSAFKRSLAVWPAINHNLSITNHWWKGNQAHWPTETTIPWSTNCGIDSKTSGISGAKVMIFTFSNDPKVSWIVFMPSALLRM